MFLHVCVCPQGGAWSWGVPGPGGCGAPQADENIMNIHNMDMSQEALLWAVCILLECILVTIVVTPPSLKPMMSRTSVQHSTAKPKVQTQTWGQHPTTFRPLFLESLVF